MNWPAKSSAYGEPILNPDVEGDYFDEGVYNQNNQFLVTDQQQAMMSNRDPRSKFDSVQSTRSTSTLVGTETKEDSTTMSSADDKSAYGIYDYKNVHNSRNRLLHDLNSVPSEILRETFFKTRERQLRRSKFEQRDITAHKDKLKDNDEVRKLLDAEKRASYNGTALHLWDLESEKELTDNYGRGKRGLKPQIRGVPKLTSIGNLNASLQVQGVSFSKYKLVFMAP